MDEVINLVENILKTEPGDIDRRLGKLSEEMLKKMTKNIILSYQELEKKYEKKKSDVERYRYYGKKLEDLLVRAIGPKSIERLQ